MSVILRSGKTPGGVEVRTILKHVIARIRRHWSKVDILVARRQPLRPARGDGVVRSQRRRLHLRLRRQRRAGRPSRGPVADALCVRRAEQGAAKRRTWTMLRYGAKSWKKTRRRLVARIEATPLGLDVRYVVTSLRGSAKHLYQTIYCGRGQAENFIKLHKAQLAPPPIARRAATRGPIRCG